MGNKSNIKNWKVRIIARITAIVLLFVAISSTLLEKTLSVGEEDLNWKAASQQVLYSVEQMNPAQQNKLVHTFTVNRLQETLQALQDKAQLNIHGKSLPLSEPNEAVKQAVLKLDNARIAYIKTLENTDKSKQQSQYSLLSKAAHELDQSISDYFNQKETLLNILLNILNGISVIVIILLFIVSAKLLFGPLYKLYEVTRKMANGELSETEAEESDSEVGMIGQNINQLSLTIKKAAEFTQEIEKGNLQADYSLDQKAELSNNLLAQNLIRMRDKMKTSAEADKQRRWSTEGLALFVDILRKDNQGLEALADNILSHLVKYLKANQGAIFIVDDENSANPKLEMACVYAYDRKKFLDKKIEAGEGLVGQTFLEAETIYLTEVPENYVEITSGLGEATPRSVLLVPMKVNDKVLGVIEMASFNKFESYEIEFIEKLGENIASTISNAKVNEKTRKLLHESQIMAEQMRAQEEEMRQNMEEMQATQEEMQRSQAELQKTYEQMAANEKMIAEKEANLNAILNSTEDSIISIDRNYCVLVANEVVKKRYEGAGLVLEKGINVLNNLDEETAKSWKEYYDRVFNGETYNFTIESTHEGEESTFRHYFLNPIYGEDNEVYGVSVTSRDVTAEKRTEMQIQNLLEEAQNDAEILKAQEDMMSKQMKDIMTAQEEMSKAQQELKDKENNLDGIINNNDDTIIMIDTDFQILVMNDVLKNRYKGTQYETLDVGHNVIEMLDDSVRDEWIGYYERGFAGEKLDFTIKSSVKGEESYRNYRINPVKNELGDIYAVVVFSRDVTKYTLLELENRQLKGQK